jgi:hypothetical protein
MQTRLLLARIEEGEEKEEEKRCHVIATRMA